MNKVIIIGNIGGDPELRQSQNGMAFASFSLATSEWEKDAEKTEWHKVVVIGKAAEHVGKYYRKGMKLAVDGKIQTRSWEDKDGVKRYMTEIITFQKPEWVGGEKPQKSSDESAQVATKTALDEVPF